MEHTQPAVGAPAAGAPPAKPEPPAAGEPSGKPEPSAAGEPSGKRKGQEKRKGPVDRSRLMMRDTAREVAVHLAYELSFTHRTAAELLAERLTPEAFASLAEEDAVYAIAPDELQINYITRLVSGISTHAAELDGYIEKYAVGWKFSRIPLVASAVMRVAMYEVLYMPEIPNASAIHSAVNIARKYETPETVRFINGILGSFVRQEIGE